MSDKTTEREKLEMLCRFVHQGFGWERLAKEYPGVHELLIEVLGADYRPGELTTQSDDGRQETVHLTENQQTILHRAMRRSLRIIA